MPLVVAAFTYHPPGSQLLRNAEETLKEYVAHYHDVPALHEALRGALAWLNPRLEVGAEATMAATTRPSKRRMFRR